jgi:ketosteroid isomerase-like protein
MVTWIAAAPGSAHCIEKEMMIMALLQTAAQENMRIIRAWIDAHNRQDMKALDYLDENIEILEIPTGVVYKGMAKMKELAQMAYRRHVWKEITHIMATDEEVCVEYTVRADISQPLTEGEKAGGLHGVDISKAKTSKTPFELKLCFVCHIKDGKIDLAREYWDAATITRQLGIASPLTRLLTFFMRHSS